MFASFEAAVIRHLSAIGIDNSLTKFAELERRGTTFIEQLVHEGVGGRAQDSKISLDYSDPKPGRVLSIDIGGTNVRAAVRSVEADGSTTWRPLPAYKVKDLDVGSVEPPLMRFCYQLFSRIARDCGSPDGLDSLAIVWSNAIESFRLDGVKGVRGIGARALNPEQLSTKGEFFMADLQSGASLVEPFLAQAGNHGIAARRLVIANDVPFTFKYPPGLRAHGGMVASTGANATIVLDGCLCNPEMGVQLKVPADFLSEPEAGADGEGRRFQDLCCGVGLSASMNQIVIELAKRPGCSQLRAMADGLELALDRLEAPDISLLLADRFDEFRSNRDPNGTSDAVCSALKQVAEALCKRAFNAAALMAYLSVYNQAQQTSEPLTVVVESSLARGMPGFRTGMEEAIRRISAEQVRLISPTEIRGITTPMIGAARALDSCR